MKNNYETWKRIANKLAKIDSNIEPALVAQLMTNQENFIKKNKTILDVAKENFKKRKKNNARLTTSKRNRKTNFSALENDLELNNEYFKSISDMVGNAARQGQTSVKIPYREDPRFTDIMAVLKWKGYKIKHYRCTNWQTLYYQDPVYQELSFEPATIDEIISLVNGYFSLEW